MKICQHCNSQMEDTSVFCSRCGTPFPGTQQAAEREQDCLYVLRRNLRHEMVVWRSFGIFSLILFLFLVILILSNVNSHGLFSEGLIACIAISPTLIVSFYQSSVLSRLEKSVYEDCSEAVERAERPLYIVLGAIFNEISWIFAMLNLIHVKNNEEIFDQIIQKQQSR